MIDTVRDADSTRALPRLIQALLEVLRSSPSAFNKETLEYQFRKVAIEILHRVPVTEAIRPQAQSLCSGLLHVLQTDNEENGVICCKIMIDLIRGLKYSSDDFVTSFLDILTQLLTTISSVVEEFLSENSPVLDSNVLLPSQRSFKVLAEMGMVVVSLSQVNRTGILNSLPKTIPLSIAVLSFESPAQKKAREDHEAMGQVWAGMAPTVRNVTIYTDLLNAQIKVRLISGGIIHTHCCFIDHLVFGIPLERNA
jgi:transformation/transcription domain-associated protein